MKLTGGRWWIWFCRWWWAREGWVSRGDLGLGGGWVWHMVVGWLPQPADPQLSTNPVCVCVFLCAYAPWKMPPSAIHTSIEGANKGHTWTVAPLYVWSFVLCPHFDSAGSRAKAFTRSSLHLYRKSSYCETLPSASVKAERWQRREIVMSISFYFSAQWSERDGQKALETSILSAQSMAKESGSAETREVSSKRKW